MLGVDPLEHSQHQRMLGPEEGRLSHHSRAILDAIREGRDLPCPPASVHVLPREELYVVVGMLELVVGAFGSGWYVWRWLVYLALVGAFGAGWYVWRWMRLALNVRPYV
jgi:hypothetical protein